MVVEWTSWCKTFGGLYNHPQQVLPKQLILKNLSGRFQLKSADFFRGFPFEVTWVVKSIEVQTIGTSIVSVALTNHMLSMFITNLKYSIVSKEKLRTYSWLCWMFLFWPGCFFGWSIDFCLRFPNHQPTYSPFGWRNLTNGHWNDGLNMVCSSQILWFGGLMQGCSTANHWLRASEQGQQVSVSFWWMLAWFKMKWRNKLLIKSFRWMIYVHIQPSIMKGSNMTSSSFNII